MRFSWSTLAAPLLGAALVVAGLLKGSEATVTAGLGLLTGSVARSPLEPRGDVAAPVPDPLPNPVPAPTPPFHGTTTTIDLRERAKVRLAELEATDRSDAPEL